MSWLEISILVPVVLYVALRLVLGVAIVATHLIETRPVCSMVPAPPEDPGPGRASAVPDGFNPYQAPESTTGYPETRNRRAEETGFTPHGLYVQGKGGIYQARFALWESPSRGILAVVTWGTVARIKVDKTILYTPTDDGRYLVTSDKPTGVQAPWIFEDEIVLNADFDGLVAAHTRRHRESGRPARPFSEPDALADYRGLRTRLIQSYVDRGEAYYVDPDRSAVRSTLKGALMAFARTWRPPKVVRA
jgi:hypothetical protein